MGGGGFSRSLLTARRNRIHLAIMNRAGGAPLIAFGPVEAGVGLFATFVNPGIILHYRRVEMLDVIDRGLFGFGLITGDIVVTETFVDDLCEVEDNRIPRCLLQTDVVGPFPSAGVDPDRQFGFPADPSRIWFHTARFSGTVRVFDRPGSFSSNDGLIWTNQNALEAVLLRRSGIITQGELWVANTGVSTGGALAVQRVVG